MRFLGLEFKISKLLNLAADIQIYFTINRTQIIFDFVFLNSELNQ